MTPYEAVPSLLQAVIVPMCEGIGVGLLAGVVLTWAMKLVERFFAPAPKPVKPVRRKVIVSNPPPLPQRPTRSQPAGRLILARAC